ncbi:MAG: hypothetical protein BGO05_18255 [Rhizobiales bacterium 63-7]|nr:MAG: hypothetical protein BGO05_18255 [Rhizobiales bacterium 63-7]
MAKRAHDIDSSSEWGIGTAETRRLKQPVDADPFHIETRCLRWLTKRLGFGCALAESRSKFFRSSD